MTFLAIFALILVSAFFGLKAWRAIDALGAADSGRRMAVRREGEAAAASVFDPAMVDDLPPPARRFFLHAIRPGTPLCRVARITMHGEIGLGSRSAPGYRPITAGEVLAPPHGFVWRVEAGRGLARLSGSDALTDTASWSRFWLLGLLPVVRDGGDDHRRAAFGRLVAETVFWVPAALLPGDGIRWSAVDDTTARVELQHKGLVQSVDITVADDGRPTQVLLQRWTNANRHKRYQEQPFGGQLHDFREIDGYRVPTRVEAGNHFGTEDYFPFFRVTVDTIRFADSGSARDA
jgi:hypothetical protein